MQLAQNGSWQWYVAFYAHQISAAVFLHLHQRSKHVHSQSVAISPTAFDEKVPFWLQCVRSLPCVCARMLHYLYVGLHITIAQYHNAVNTRTRQGPGTLKSKS